jgi:lipoprotein Spr
LIGQMHSQPFAIDSVRIDSLLIYAQSFLGIHYKYASCEPSRGFDCSGFVYYVYQKSGMKVPRSSKEYANFGKKIKLDSCRKGDIIVFTGTNAKNRKPGHVGIVLSGNGEHARFIHSSSNKKHNGVIISTFDESPYYRKRYITVVRVFN